MTTDIITSYVIFPRDESCSKVNPLLWEEFLRCNGKIKYDHQLYTEAYCVQYIDNYYDQLKDKDISNEMGHTVVV